MKIISKYKDYYDYLKGIYGEDPKLILDRRGFKDDIFNKYEEFLNSKDPHLIKIKLGNNHYVGIWYNQKLYYGKELEQFIVEEDKSKYNKWLAKDFNDKNLYIKLPELKKPINILQGICKKSDSIICLYFVNLLDVTNSRSFYSYIHPEFIIQIEYPNLSLIKGIGGLIDPHTAWINLSDYLSEQITKSEPEQPVGDDIIRLQAAGFDKKTSFRNIK